MKSLVFLALVLAVARADGDVRLMDRDGNINTQEGRVQVRLDGQDGVWGEVCGDYFGKADAQVVCKELGSEDGVGSAETGNYGIGEEKIVIGHVDCNGGETSILQCSYTPMKSCKTSIAAVNCDPSLGATGSIGLEAGIIAAIVICLVGIVALVILFGTCLWRNDVCLGGKAVA